MAFPVHGQLDFDICAETDNGRGESTWHMLFMLHQWDMWSKKYQSCSVCIFLVGLVSRGNRQFWVNARDDTTLQGLTRWITPGTARRYWSRHVVNRGRDWFMCFAEKTVQGHAVPRSHAVSHVMMVLVTPNRGAAPVAVVFDPFETGVEWSTYLPANLPNILKQLFCKGCNPHALGVTRVLWMRGDQTGSEMTCLQNALKQAQRMLAAGPTAWLKNGAAAWGMHVTRKGHISQRHASVQPSDWITWL